MVGTKAGDRSGDVAGGGRERDGLAGMPLQATGVYAHEPEGAHPGGARASVFVPMLHRPSRRIMRARRTIKSGAPAPFRRPPSPSAGLFGEGAPARKALRPSAPAQSAVNDGSLKAFYERIGQRTLDYRVLQAIIDFLFA